MTDAGRPSPILNRQLPDLPWHDPRTGHLPGISPLDPGDWIWVLDSYAAQMAERERLLAGCPDRVHALPDAAMEAGREALDAVLAALARRGDFRLGGDAVRCPDGRRVQLDREAPLMTIGRLVQEDLCLMMRPDGGREHVLAGAVLCFPAGWTLAEKLGRPLLAIHGPVPEYDAGLARRVQRLLDGVQEGRPLWRMNRLWSQDPTLFQPRREGAPRPDGPGPPPYFRSERQCLVRLPRSGAVAFSIHTMVVDRRAALAAGVE